MLFQHHQYAERMVMVILVNGDGKKQGSSKYLRWVRVIQDNEECVILLPDVGDTYE